jgi:hypothetical protein
MFFFGPPLPVTFMNNLFRGNNLPGRPKQIIPGEELLKVLTYWLGKNSLLLINA